MKTPRNEQPLCKCNGKFFFSPERPGLRKDHRAMTTGIILKVDNGISEYYSWMLHRHKGIELSKPAWGTHITVVNDRDKVKDLDAFNALKSKYHQKVIQIEYSASIKKQWQFWILEVKPNNVLTEIRRELGLFENYPFHITVGRDDIG